MNTGRTRTPSSSSSLEVGAKRASWLEADEAERFSALEGRSERDASCARFDSSGAPHAAKLSRQANIARRRALDIPAQYHTARIAEPTGVHACAISGTGRFRCP